jgi:hypothetical protein
MNKDRQLSVTQWAILARASGHMVLFTKFEC